MWGMWEPQFVCGGRVSPPRGSVKAVQSLRQGQGVSHAPQHKTRRSDNPYVK